MKRKAPITRKAVMLLVGIILINGCVTSKPAQIALEPNASVSRYRVIAVAPASVNFGVPLDSQLAAELRLDIEGALKQKGYQIASYDQAPKDTLIVRCDYETYVPEDEGKNNVAFAAIVVPALIAPSPQLISSAAMVGASEASVIVTLEDKGSGKSLGNFDIDRRSPLGVHRLQKDVAAAIADSIDAAIKGS